MCEGTCRAKLAGCHLIDGGVNPTVAVESGCPDVGIARMAATDAGRQARSTGG